MHRTDHWLTQLKGTKLPNHHLVMDTEAELTRVGSRYEHRFAVAAISHVVRDGTMLYGAAPPKRINSAESLWGQISAEAAACGELVVWAHNLAYDLRVSDALAQLTEREWELENISLVPQATWSSWRYGKTKLMLCDTLSWLPVPLDKIAAALGKNRARPNYVTASLVELAECCLVDTLILSVAVCRMLNYLRSNDLGNFRPTGSGQSHAALRRRFLPERSIRVHCDNRALVAEREAAHTGRCEAWRHGRIKETLHEYDLNLAYCRIAAENQLPGELAGERAHLTFKDWALLEPEYAVLAEVIVNADYPVVPVTTDEGVIWPVGNFRTVLWDCELDQLYLHTNDIQIRRAWLYRRTNALQSMCQWLLDRLHPDDEQAGQLEKRMLKHWARTVVGRCGLRYRSWEPFGTHPRPDMCISYEPDDDTGEVNQNMRIGRQMLQLSALTESHSSVPAIPSWVAARCRVALWQLILFAGVDNVYYMDTDGLLVNTTGRNNMERMTAQWRGGSIVYKGEHRGVTIYGPRNVELGDERRLSGVPKRAIRRDELTFEGETWSGLEYALQSGHTDVVEVSQRFWRVTPADSRRIHNDDGTTQPHRLELDETG